MGSIISITNNKGGCGKTTTACNLADAISKRGKQVLVIDADSQCNTTSLLLQKNTAIRNSLYDLLNPENEHDNLKDFFYTTNCKNVILIPNIAETAALEPRLIKNAPNSLFRLRKLLRNQALNNYDFTIIDNPPNMGTFVLCSLYASDFVVVPIKAGSAFSVEGLLKATKLIEEIRKNGNDDLRFLRLLINSLDKRTAISTELTNQIKKTFDKNQIFKTQIPVNTAFEKAESSGKTVFQYDPTATGAKAFRKLAKELVDILEV